jgi:lysophospholipase L1-like esterase
VNYAALGASDTIGFGGSSPCLPLIECTTGTGYVQRMTQRLTADGKTVALVNLGVPGAVLSPEVQALGNTMGLGILRNVNMDEAPYVPRNTTLVTIFIGANDANTVGRAIRAGTGGADPTAYVQTHVQNFARDMRTFVSTVRGRASTTRIIALNLPNMAAMPYANDLTLTEKRWLQQITVGFSAGVNALVAQGVLVIDLMCDANFYNPAILSADGFHPNDAGYARMADLVYTAATTGTAPTPQSTCAFMTVH